MAIVPDPRTPDTPALRWRQALWPDDHPQALDLQRRLPREHLARQIDPAVSRLDLRPLYACYHGTGDPPYPPDVLLRVVLYEARCGRPRPAQWFRDAHDADPVRWLLRGWTPSRSCWYAFRDRLGPVLDTLHRQVLTLAQDAGHTPATRAAQDGTLVAANASRHRLVNDATLQRRMQQLAAACAADAQGTPPTPLPAWMARRPAGRRRQQQRCAQARARLDERQAYQRRKRASKRKAAAPVRVSLSDPEAAVGRDKEKVYRPLYNVQVIDDLDSPLILGYAVFAQPNDAGLLGVLLAQVQQAVGHALTVVLADGSYSGGEDLAAAARAGATVYAPLPQAEAAPAQLPKRDFVWLPDAATYVCPHGHRLVLEKVTRQQRSTPAAVTLTQYRCPPVHCLGCPLRQRCTPNPARGRSISRSEHEDFIEALRTRMETPAARALYKLRSQTVELVNADWKEHRQLRRFSGRGLLRARLQVGVLVVAHNLLVLLSPVKKAPTAATPAETAA